MNNREYLVQCLQEECAEVIQVCSKINRFGLTSVQPITGKLNIENLITELTDVLAIVELLEEDGVPLSLNIGSKEMIEKKKQKVLFYMNNTRKEGVLK